MSKPTALVMAGNYNQYISCLGEYDLDRRTTRYITEHHDIHGIDHKSVKVYCYGFYWRNPIYNNRHAYYWLTQVLATDVIYQSENPQKEDRTMATVVISADYETQTHEYADVKDLTIMVDGRIVYQSTQVKGTAGSVFIGGSASNTIISTGNNNNLSGANISYGNFTGGNVQQTTVVNTGDNNRLNTDISSKWPYNKDFDDDTLK